MGNSELTDAQKETIDRRIAFEPPGKIAKSLGVPRKVVLEYASTLGSFREKKRRAIEMRILMLSIPVVLLLLFEIVLLMSDYGVNLELMVSNPADEKLLIVNPALGRRYLPGSVEEYRTSRDMMLAVKPKNAFRVFIFGESVAAGFPYMNSGRVAAMLRSILRDSLSDVLVEVVDFSAPGLNAFAAADLVDDALEYEPDVIVLHAGYNEFHDADGSGNSLGERIVSKLVLNLKYFRTFQLLQNIVTSAISSNDVESGLRAKDALGVQFSRRSPVRYQSPEYISIIDAYKRSIDDILDDAESSGVRVVGVTLVSNLSGQAPFYSIPPEKDISGNWNLRIEKARILMQAGNYDGALRFLDWAAKLYDESAELHHLKGMCYDVLGEWSDSRTEFSYARDLDALRFRPPSDLNIVLSNLFQVYGQRLVDIEEAFAEYTETNLIGDDIMVDAIHPAVEGYALMASRIADAILLDSLEFRMLPQSSGAENLGSLSDLTEVDKAAAQIRIDRLKSGYPYVRNAASYPNLDYIPVNPVEFLAYDISHERIEWVDGLMEYADSLVGILETDEAMIAYSALIMNSIREVEPYYKLAEHQIMLGSFDEAYKTLALSTEIDWTGFASKWMGIILLSRGEAGKAIQMLTPAYVAMPLDLDILYNLAFAYAETGQDEEAKEILVNLLEIEPAYPGARELLKKITPK